MFFIIRHRNNEFPDPFQKRINWQIKNPIDGEWGIDHLEFIAMLDFY
jgi:hypothetical protein